MDDRDRIPTITPVHIRHFLECQESPRDCGTCADIERLLRGIVDRRFFVVPIPPRPSTFNGQH